MHHLVNDNVIWYTAFGHRNEYNGLFSRWHIETWYHYSTKDLHEFAFKLCLGKVTIFFLNFISQIRTTLFIIRTDRHNVFKDLSMMYRVARYIMLKSDHDINYLVLIHYGAEICKGNSKTGGGKACLLEIRRMNLWVTCKATLCDVTMIPVSLNLHKIRTQICANVQYFWKFAV